MAEIEAQFLAEADLTHDVERRFHTIFFSHIHPFPLMVLGLNPGGDPETPGKFNNASDKFFENYEHNLVKYARDPTYRLAQPLAALIGDAIGTRGAEFIRQVPFTNVVFHRSPPAESGSRSFAEIHGCTFRRAFELGQNTLQRLVRLVDPDILLVVSRDAYRYLKLLCTDRSEDNDTVCAPNGSHPVMLYQAASAVLFGRRRRLLVCAHPSKFAGRSQWHDVISRVVDECKQFGINPIEHHAAIRSLPPLPDHPDLASPPDDKILVLGDLLRKALAGSN